MEFLSGRITLKQRGTIKFKGYITIKIGTQIILKFIIVYINMARRFMNKSNNYVLGKVQIEEVKQLAEKLFNEFHY